MDKNSCLVVFSPKEPKKYNNRKRFLVTLNTPSVYIGKNNALNAVVRFNNCRTDKCIIKLRKCGKIEIYSKQLQNML